MNERGSDDLVRRAAARAAEREGFVAAALAVYQELYGMDEEKLAAFLGGAPDDLPRLALCRRPAPDAAPAVFRAGVERIAAYAGVRAPALAALLREVDAVGALRGAGGDAAPGTLMAARDRVHDLPAPADADGEAAAQDEAGRRPSP